MTIVVLVILAMVWAAVLGPGLIRRRVERRSNDSIGAFHRQLRVLERTGPTLVDPAYRLDEPDTAGAIPFRASFPAAMPRSGLGGEAASARRYDPYFRPEACKRRRDILLGLLGSVVATGMLGAVPALRPILFVTIVFGVLLAGYVALLVYLRNLAIEREVKLRYLPQPAQADSSSLARRVASH